MKLRSLLAFSGALTLGYAAYEPWRLEISRRDIVLPGLPAAAAGTRILQISDLHYGALMPGALLDRIVAAAKAEMADIIALTGDMVSRRESYSRFTLAKNFARPVMEYAEIVAREIGALRPPQGIYAVPGNHDLWEGSFGPIADTLAKFGIESLLNRSIQLESGLFLAGVDDLRAGRPKVSAALAAMPYAAPQVILNHNPRLALLLASRNALILSGHTHAGQVRLIGSQLRRFPVDLGQNFYLDGLYRLGPAQLYVSRGAGCVHFPFRFGARPEITVLTLKTGEPEA